jgi:hypothetical protein
VHTAAQVEAREHGARVDSHNAASDRSSATNSDVEARRNGGGQAASTGGASEDARQLTAAGDLPPETTAAHAASGGRDAGAGTDVATDAALSQAWQGELATTLRTLATPPPSSSRADPSLAADYESATADGTVTRPGTAFTPAAAAPQARRKPSLGPVEQAYVRAYFAAPGATP